MFKLTANVIEGEDEGEEGGCFAWSLKVFSEALDVHDASKAGDAAVGYEVFPVDVDAHDE